MTSIYLIRHGQASFGKAEYDCLSELGEQQARHLGAGFKARLTNKEFEPQRYTEDTEVPEYFDL